MSAFEQVQETARSYLRDFPRFYQVHFEVVGRTYELGQGNLDASRLWVAHVPEGQTTPVELTDFSIDPRNGILRLATTPAAGKILAEGYYYEWVTPEDLSFYARKAVNAHLHNLDYELDQLAPVVLDVIGIDAVVETLWALLTEYARDIDVMTSESIHIPASQRYRMVQSLVDFWMTEYEKKARALNIGLHRIEMFTLRRVSRTTNRLVPVVKAKELGDYGPLERLWTDVDRGTIELTEGEDDLRTDVYIDGRPPHGYVTGHYF